MGMFTFTAGKLDDPQWATGGTRAGCHSVGHAFKTMGDIEAIGDDFFWDESGGLRQRWSSGLPVGCGGPSLRIRNVVVGGEAVE
jgi:TldD protein